MAGKLLHIGNNYGSFLTGTLSADSLGERNGGAGRLTLERTEDQGLSPYKIEADPVNVLKEPEKKGGNI